MQGTRVLKAHRAAVLDSVKEFTRLGRAGHKEEAATVMATAVLTALDTKTQFVVGVRTPNGDAEIYGPYATAAAAQKAIDGGIANQPGCTAGVWPLIPGPRALKPPVVMPAWAEQLRIGEQP